MKMLKFVPLFLVAAVAASPPVTKSRSDIERFISALEKTREDDGLTIEERMETLPYNNIWESSGKFQGDIVLDDAMIDEMASVYATGRNAYIVPNTKWPSNTVIYEFGSGEFNANQQAYIRSVMDIFERRTCVRFRPRTNNDRVYVRITGKPDGCYAHVGYIASRGIHTMNLARDHPGFGCHHGIVIAHELLHVLGFFHMHSTYNRYDYVRIHWENIQNGYAFAFDMYDRLYVSNLGLPYEYGSCMHYTLRAFSANGQPTISTTRPYSGVVGQQEVITGYDIWRLGRHYNCAGFWSTEAMNKAKYTKLVLQEDGTFIEKVNDTPTEDLGSSAT